MENVELKILDEQDREVPRGAWGEICIQGPGVMKGYWGKPEETARALRGGWLHSGDIGTMDDEGYVSIVDRVKDMINVSGFKVWPAEVEAMLYAHPDIQEAVIIAARDARRGETVKAIVVLKPAARDRVMEADLQRWARDNMAAYKVPSSFEFVEALPKSATGKILWRVLQEQQDERDRAGG